MRTRDRLRHHRRSKGRSRRLCSLRPAPLADPRFRRLVARFHALGPRALAELLAELGAERLLRTTIETRPEEYLARLDRNALVAVEGFELTAIRPRRVP